MKRFFLWAFIILCANQLYAQPWSVKDSLSRTGKSTVINTFNAERESFKRYWDGKKVEKGKGYKPFKRWEYFMAPRVNSAGKLNNRAYWDALKLTSSTISDQNWQFVGPSETPYIDGAALLSGNGRLNCIAFHPTNENIIYVGAPSGGFWKSINGGQTWNTTTDKLGSLGVSDIAINPDNPNEIYIVTGDGDAYDTYSIGILKSTDGGETWNETSLTLENQAFRRIIINGDNPDIMLATSSNGIYRTTDGWATNNFIVSGVFKDIEFKPGDYSVVLATRYSFSGDAKVYKSTNGGQSFSPSTTGMDIDGDVDRIELAVSPANNNIVYALCSDSDNSGFAGLYVSKNMGDSWEVAYDGDINVLGFDKDGGDVGGQGWYDLSLAVNPSNAKVLFVGGINIWKSIFGGKVWNLSSYWSFATNYEYVHADHHMLAFSPLNGKLYSANDGGLYVSSDNGATWTSISNGLEITQYYRMGISGGSNNVIIGGTQDNGTLMYRDGDWTEVLGGDGMDCLIDYSDDNTMYAEIYYGDIYRSTSGGSSFINIKPDEAPDGEWVTPYTIHPTDPNTLIIGFDELYMTHNQGDDWTKVTDNLESRDGINFQNLTYTLFSTSHTNNIYIGNSKDIWRTKDYGATWENISEGLPLSSNISSIAVSHEDPNQIWVAFSNGNAKVYYTDNGGASWVDYSTGLPNVAISSIVVRKESDGELYVGTDVGVYTIDAGKTSWENINGTLPNVVIGELELNYDNTRLYAATYGRGMWYTELAAPIKAVASFNSLMKNICLDVPVKIFYDGASEYDSLVWDISDGEILEINKDTITAKWSTAGEKDIFLGHYFEGVLNTRKKLAFLNVGNVIDFNLTIVNSASLCSDEKVKIITNPDFDLEWYPDGSMEQLSAGFLEWTPSTTTTYRFTATHGNCVAEKYVSLKYSPDDVCNAKMLNTGFNGPFNNGCATAQTNEARPEEGECNNANNQCCNMQNTWCSSELELHNTAWFKVEVPETGNLSVWTEGLDTKIALYRANNCNGLLNNTYEILAANDDYDALDNYASAIEQLTGLTPGETLWLQVDGSFGGATGDFFVFVGEDFNPTDDPDIVYNNIEPKVFPNPTTGGFSVSLKLPELSALTLEVYNSTGRRLTKRFIAEESYSFEEQFNLNLSDGIYFVVISTNKKRYIKKLVVQ